MLNDDLLDKLFGWSYNRLRRREAAEELTQEICLRLLEAAARAERIENIWAWIWSVARYTLIKYQRDNGRFEFDIDDFETLASYDDTEETILQNEEINALRHAVSELSGKYREIIVLHYVYEKTVSEIAPLMSLPANTVKWRLREARNAITRKLSNKKGLNRMNAIGEKAYNPQRFEFLADGWWKSQADEALGYNNAGRALMQNIMLEANCRERTSEELSRALGVPTAYVEDELANAVKLGLMRKTGSKYMTNFIIQPSDAKAKYTAIHKKYAPYFFHESVDFLKSKESEIRALDFTARDWEWSRLLWHLLMFMRFGYERAQTKLKMTENKPEMKPTGGWIGWCWEAPVKPEDEYDKRLTAYYGPFRDDRPYGRSGCASCFVNEDNCDIAAPYQNYFMNRDGYDLLRKIRAGERPGDLSGREREILAAMIANGFIAMKDGNLSFNFPLFTGGGFEKLQALLSSFGDRISDAYEKMADEITAVFKRTNVPACLRGDIGIYVCNALHMFTAAIIVEAVERNMLYMPADGEKPYLMFYAVI